MGGLSPATLIYLYQLWTIGCSGCTYSDSGQNGVADTPSNSSQSNRGGRFAVLVDIVAIGLCLAF